MLIALCYAVNVQILKVESHSQYLLELISGWIKSIKVSKGVFLKIEKQVDLKVVMEKLRKRTKKALAIDLKVIS